MYLSGFLRLKVVTGTMNSRQDFLFQHVMMHSLIFRKNTVEMSMNFTIRMNIEMQ